MKSPTADPRRHGHSRDHQHNRSILFFPTAKPLDAGPAPLTERAFVSTHTTTGRARNFGEFPFFTLAPTYRSSPVPTADQVGEFRTCAEWIYNSVGATRTAEKDASFLVGFVAIKTARASALGSLALNSCHFATPVNETILAIGRKHSAGWTGFSG